MKTRITISTDAGAILFFARLTIIKPHKVSFFFHYQNDGEHRFQFRGVNSQVLAALGFLEGIETSDIRDEN